MSGGDVAYNIRPNKYVERQLFADLLRRIMVGKAPDDYVYISFGGPQLEDQRIVFQQLGITHLISIEFDRRVWERQKFNLRNSCIDCWNISSGDLISNIEIFTQEYSNKEFIVWLDYAAANERLEQLLEFQTLLGKLEQGDVVKITLNANPGTLAQLQPREKMEDLLQRRLEMFLDQLGDQYPSSSLSSNDMTGKLFPRALGQAVKCFALAAVNDRHTIQPVPLAIFSYQDGNHLMLTVTVQLMKGSEVVPFKENLRAHGYNLPSDWNDVTSINVPNLTAKEQLYIEAHLPTDDLETVHSNLPFKLASSEDRSLDILREFEKHHRHYPSFAQVIL